jgi:hypothetical protein
MKPFRTDRRTLHRIALAALLCAFSSSVNALAQFDDALGDPQPEEASRPEGTRSVDTVAQSSGTPERSDLNAEPNEAEEQGSESGPQDPVVEAPPPPPVPASPQYQTLWQGLRSDKNRFGIDGGFEMDVANADYRNTIETQGKEKFYDFRGQTWIAPVMEHRFGKNDEAFLRASVEFVAWLREEFNIYQVNVFDAYAQAGVNDIADIKVGRVTTWRIFQPGNGFDIFTLEDTGALRSQPINGGDFFPFRYEVDMIWLRDTPGRAALHLYPLKKFVPAEWANLGIEITGEYGKINLNNVLGARLAMIYDHKWFRLAGGAETRKLARAQEVVDASGAVCEECFLQQNKGFGGSVVARPPFVTAGLNYGDARYVNNGANGQQGAPGETDKVTQGGFIELHTGHLLASTKDEPRPDWTADQRSENIRKITVGYGRRRTETLIGNGDFMRHDQQAAYIKYNLGFNESFIKLVGSYSKGISLDNTRAISEEPAYIRIDGDMLSARMRFAYYW